MPTKVSESVQSVERTLDLFEALLDAGRPVTISELGRRVELPLGTAHRLLATLVARGYARQDESRCYAVGFKVIDWASRIGPGQLIDLARPLMTTLMEETGETVNLVTLDRTQIVYADQVAPQRLVRMFTQVGNRAPLHSSGSGKALLAFRPPEAATALLEQIELKGYTPRTITTAAAMQKELVRVRERGYAIDDGEFEDGVRCIAAPVLNGAGNAIAAISISGPASRVTPEKVDDYAQKVLRCAGRVSQALGFGKRGYRSAARRR